MGRILYWQYLLIGIFNRIIILNSNGLKIVILLQHPFQVRSLVEYLPSKLCVEDNPPVPIVQQGARADIQPLAHFFACKEVLTAKQRFVCLCHFLNSFAYTADSGQHHLHIVSIHIQISYLFHNLRVYLLILVFPVSAFSVFVWSNCSTSSRL